MKDEFKQADRQWAALGTKVPEGYRLVGTDDSTMCQIIERIPPKVGTTAWREQQARNAGDGPCLA